MPVLLSRKARNKRMLPPSPVEMRKKARTTGAFKFSANVPAKLARALPYVGPSVAAAQRIYRGYKASRALFKKFRPSTTRRRGGSAANSRSAGYFKTDGLTPNQMSRFLNQGVILHNEHGEVITDAVRQVIYVGHSTTPAKSIMRVTFASLLKTLFKKAGLKVKNWDSPILFGANIPARVELSYKLKEGDQETLHAFVLTTASTLDSVVSAMLTWINTFNADSFPKVLTRIAYYHDIGTFGSSRLIAYDLDLSSCTVEFLCLSHLKIQNRTINSTGNDQADDIDNVPIYGRSFDVNNTGTQFRDYNQPATAGKPILVTDPEFGSINYVPQPSAAGTTFYNEVPMPQQIVGCKSHGKAHLDPGQIKTSKLQTTKTCGLNKIISLYKTYNQITNTNVDMFWMGQSRFFGFEKMINAVAMTSTNQFNLAFEHDLKIGAICRQYENHQTGIKSVHYTGGV